jgi:hypothetical protein
MCNRWGDILSPIFISFLRFYHVAYFLLLKVYSVSRGKVQSFLHSFITDTACNRWLCIGLYLIHSTCKWPKVTQPRLFSCPDSRARICNPFKEPRSRFPVWRTGPPRYKDWLKRFYDRFLGSLNVYKYGLRNHSVRNIALFLRVAPCTALQYITGSKG